MTNQFTDTTFAVTYKDDYADSDNYHRVLFNSGRALQARELTQMQTIIQKEIERFANNVFRTGSQVNPAGLTLNTNMEFVKLAGNPDISGFEVGQIVTESGTGIAGRIKRIEAYVDAENPATFYIDYTSTVGGTSSDAVGDREASVRFTPAGTITNGNGTSVSVQTTDTEVDPAVGVGTAVSVSTGAFYAAGHFVQCNPQTIMVDRYFAYPTAQVGFRVDQDIVTSDDNSALYDNQNVLPNETAPGADRYRIRLTLVSDYDLGATDNFVYLNAIVDGIFLNETEKSTYGIVGDEIAKRTAEESGNYTVEPFNLEVETDVADSDFLLLDLSEGTAYVDGYRYATTANTAIALPRARETETIVNDVIAANFGNFITVNGATAKGFPNVNTFEEINLRDSAGYLGSTIGTARVRSVEASGSNYNYYLFDVNMNAGEKFSDVRSLGTSSTAVADTVLEYGNARLNDTANSDLFFTMRHERPRALTDISLTVQRRVTVTLDGSGVGTINLSAADETFTSTNTWIIARTSDGEIITADSVTGSGTAAATITHASSASQEIEVLVQVNKGAGEVRTKTLTETTVTAAIDSDGNGLRFVPLAKADIFDVSRITSVDSDGIALTNMFTIDNGQRDNFYDEGRLILNPGQTLPTGNVFVRYQYFAHGATGDFFSASSYTGQVKYNEIGSFTRKDGLSIELRNVLDFRSRKDDTGANFSAATARVNELPRNTDTIQADIDYYLPRKDTLVLNRDGTFALIDGNSAFEPKYSILPDGAMSLYTIELNAYTDDENDLNINYIDNRGYTMRDIGRIENRVERLEEITTLNLLEAETSKIEVLDASGNNRFKTGFFADNFSDASYTDVKSSEYRVMFDADAERIRPIQTANPIRLFLDSSASTNIRVMGNHVLMNYVDSDVLVQDFASEFENVNPFGIVSFWGTVELSPEVDYHVTVNVNKAQSLIKKYFELPRPKTAASNSVRLRYEDRKKQIRKEFNNLIGGSLSIESFEPTVTNKVSSNGRNRTARKYDFQNLTSGSFMRARKVFFRARGLKPNTKFFAFFDGFSIDDLVRQETSFSNYISRDENAQSSKFVQNENHPDGATVLQSDARGEVIGSMFIPHARYAAGTREFKLLDIEVNNNEMASSGAFTDYSTKRKRITPPPSLPKPRPVPKPRPPRPTPTPPGSVAPTPPRVITPKPSPPVKPTTFKYRLTSAGNIGFSPVQKVMTRAEAAEENRRFAASATYRARAGGRAFVRKWVRVSAPTKSYGISAAQHGLLGSRSGSVFKAPGSVRAPSQTSRQSTSVRLLGNQSLHSNHVTSATTTRTAPSPTVRNVSSNTSLFGYGNRSFGGLLNPRQCAFKDPIAQSFRLPEAMIAGGIVTEIDVFFRTRPTGDIPVRLQIRPMIAGVPDKTFIAEVQMDRDDVNIPGNLNDLTTVRATPTTFTFTKPVVLKPNEDYAFVLIADTTDYNVFVARTGELELGSSSLRISRQPSMGSMFLSQNGVTWSPDQERDIMFSMRAAVFDITQSALAEFNNGDLVDQPLQSNALFVDSGSTTIFVSQPGHGLMAGDTINLGGLDSATDYAGITGLSLQGNRTVVKVDGKGYTFVADSAATSTTAIGGLDLTGTRNIVFDEFTPTIDLFLDDNTTADFVTNFTDGASLSTANDAGNGSYTKSSINHTVFDDETLLLDAPAMIANVSHEETKLGVATRSLDMAATFSTVNKFVSPIIDLSTMSAVLGTNLIDNPDSASEVGILNNPVTFVAETDPSGGTVLAKHITETVTLNEPAVGIKVLLDAHRSNNSFIDVYFKTLEEGSDELIDDQNWVYLEEETNNPTDEDRAVVREYEYIAGGTEGTLAPFTAYKLKVVLRAGNSSRIPYVSAIRAITLGT